MWIKQNNPGKPFGRVYEIVQPLRTISDEFYYGTLVQQKTTIRSEFWVLGYKNSQ